MPHRYRSGDEDSARWLSFPFRDGDIVISTRSKCGTTWTQMMCAVLVLQSPQLPMPLGDLSPWLDFQVAPIEDVVARLDAQPNRRIVKTHTPLDGVVLDPRATYIVAARHPLDMAVSLYHQGNNIDRARLEQLTGQASPSGPRPERPALRDWLARWMEAPAPAPGTPVPGDDLDSLPGVLWHARDAWARRHDPNVVLLHYDELLADLDGQMQRLAGRLGIPIDPAVWPSLVAAARFDSMQERAADLIPDRNGILKDAARFFRQGTSGGWRDLVTADQWDRYRARTQAALPADAWAWLHQEPVITR